MTPTRSDEQPPRINLPWNRKPWVRQMPLCPVCKGWLLKRVADGTYTCMDCGRVNTPAVPE